MVYISDQSRESFIADEDREHELLFLDFLAAILVLEAHFLINTELLEEVRLICLKIQRVGVEKLSQPAHVLIVSDYCEELLYIVGEVKSYERASQFGVFVAYQVQGQTNKLIEGGSLSSIESESLALGLICVEVCFNDCGQILARNWLVLEAFASTNSLGDLTGSNALCHFVEEVGILTEHQVDFQNRKVTKGLNSLHLGLVSLLDKCLLILSPVQLMLDGANRGELLDTVLFGKLGGSLDKAILIRSA